MKSFSLTKALAGIFVALFILLLAYGLATDCPNTAGYVYCGEKPHHRFLH